MLVVAKCWIYHNGVLYQSGDRFEIDDCRLIKEYVTPMNNDNQTASFSTDVDVEHEAPVEKRRGRPKK